MDTSELLERLYEELKEQQTLLQFSVGVEQRAVAEEIRRIRREIRTLENKLKN